MLWLPVPTSLQLPFFPTTYPYLSVESPAYPKAPKAPITSLIVVFCLSLSPAFPVIAVRDTPRPLYLVRGRASAACREVRHPGVIDVDKGD